MNKDQALAIVNMMTDYGHDAEVREGYSGRGMYGKEVTAIVLEDGLDGLIGLGWAAAMVHRDLENDEDRDDYLEFDDLPTRLDSMGLGYVVY